LETEIFEVRIGNGGKEGHLSKGLVGFLEGVGQLLLLMGKMGISF
jgi:hypothetical protein